MNKSPDWIIVLLDELHLNKYPGPVIWINKCLRCGQEEPTYSGPIEIGMLQEKEFIKIHKDCKTLEDQKSHEYRTSSKRGKWPGDNTLGD